MVAEIRRLEPKPGRAFGAPPDQLATADVFVSVAPDDSWRIELNSDALPRVLVNETYAATHQARLRQRSRPAFSGRPICKTPIG